MAIRSVYEAEIDIKLSSDDIKGELKALEKAVNSSIAGIQKSLAGLSIAEAIGPQGGLADIGIRDARLLASEIQNAFAEIGKLSGDEANNAIRDIALTFGTTTESMVASLARVIPEVKPIWEQFRKTGILEAEKLSHALVGGSIIPELVDKIETEFLKLPSLTAPPIEKLIDQFERLEKEADGMVSGALSKEARAVERELETVFGKVRAEKLLGETVFNPDTLSGGLREFVRGAANEISTSFDDIFSVLKLDPGGIFTDVGNSFRELGRNTSESLRNTAAPAVEFLGEVFQEAGAKSAFLRQSVTIMGRELRDSLGTAATDVGAGLTVIGDKLSGAVSGARNFFSAMKEGGEDITGASAPLPDIRKIIAQIEQDLARMPRKTDAAFKELNRNFAETRREALKTGDAFGLEGIQDAVKELQTSEIVRLRTEFDKAGQAGDEAGKKINGSFGNVRNAITLASETGENKLFALRTAIFGLREATGPLGGLFNKFGKSLDSVAVAENKLAQASTKVAQSMSSQATTIKLQVDALKESAKLEGLNTTRLNDMDRAVNELESEYSKMVTTIQDGGEPTAKQLNQIRELYRRMEVSMKAVQEQNEETIGPETLAQLKALEKRIKSNIPATRFLAASMGGLSDKVKKAKQEQAELGDETQKSGNIFRKLGIGAKKAEDDLEGVGREMVEVGRQSEKMAKTLDVAKAALLGAFGGVVLANIAGVSGALGGLADTIGGQIEIATDRIQGAFNLLPQEAEVVSAAIAGAYRNNFGDSIEDVGNAVQIAVTRLKRLGVTSGEVIQSATEDAFRLRDAYRIDVQDSFDAVGVLMKNFNLEAAEAFDFLAGLSQKGVVGPDVLDSITEYAVQIKNAGGDAATLFNILESGFQGAGTLGTDRALDLFKEFRARIQDGSDTTEKALKQLGINSADLLKQMADGTVSVQEAFEFVINGLRGIDDQNLLMQAGVGLLGTQFEDLGQDAVLALTTIGTKMSDLEGATNNIDVMYDNFGSAMQAVNREIELSLAPISQSLLQMANAAIPFIRDALERLTPIIANVAATIADFANILIEGDWEGASEFIFQAVASAIEGIAVLMENLVDAGLNWGFSFMAQVGEGIIEAAEQVINAVIEIANAIASFLAPGSAPEKGPLAEIDKWGKGLIEVFGSSFKAADFKFLDKALKPVQDFFANSFGEGGKEAFKGVKETFLEITEELNRTGEINTDAFAEISASIGESNSQLTKFLKLQLEHKKAQNDLLKVEEEVAGAQRAGFVPAELQRKLQAAKDQVAQTKENVEWQSEFLKFQDKSKASFAGIGTAAAKGAKAATKAIKTAVDRQLEFINSGFQTEKALLDAKLANGVISQDEYLKELIKLEEKYIDASLRTGMLSGLDSHVENLNKLKAKLAELKGTAKGGLLPEGESLIADFLPKLDVGGFDGGGLVAAFQDVGSRVGISLVDGFEVSAKERIGVAMQNIGTSIQEAAQRIINRFTSGDISFGEGLITSLLLGAGAAGIIKVLAPILPLLGRLLFFASRLSAIGAIVFLVFKNWDKISVALAEVWEVLVDIFTRFTEELGGAQVAMEKIIGIFENVRDVVSEVATNLVALITDALAGKPITFQDIIDAFDFSGLDLEAIKEVGRAIVTTLTETISEKFNEIEQGGGIGADIIANFKSVFSGITEAFDEFTKEGELGAELINLFNVIKENFAEIMVVLIPLIPIILQISSGVSSSLPIIGAMGGLLTKFVPIVAAVITIVRHFGEIWPFVSDALAGAVRAISGILEIISGLFKLIDDETRAEGIQQIFTGITDVVSGTLDTLLNVGAGIATFFLALVEDISGGIAGMLEAFGFEEMAEPFRNVELAMGLFVDGVSEKVELARTILTGLTSQLGQIFELLGGDLGKILLTLSEASFRIFSELGANIANWAKGVWESVIGWFQTIYDDLVGNSILTDLVTDAIALFNELWLEITTIAKAIADGVIGFFVELPTKIGGALITLTATAKTKFEEMKTSVTTSLTTLRENAVEELLKLPIKFEEILLELINVVPGWAGDLLSAFLTGLETIKGLFTGEVGIGEIKSLFLGGLDEMKTGATEKMGEMATSIVDAVVNIPKRIQEGVTKFKESGVELAQGIGDGVKDGLGGVSSFLASSVGKITDPVEEATTGIKGFFTGMYDDLVGNSIVPETVTAIIAEFTLMNTAIIAGSNNLSIALSSFWVQMGQKWSTMVSGMLQSWLEALDGIRQTAQVFHQEFSAILEDLVQKITLAKEAIDRARAALEEFIAVFQELVDMELDNVVEAFEEISDHMKKAADRAEKFAEFLEKAAAAAKKVSNSLGSTPGPGGDPSFQRGAWEIPRDMRAIIHKKETILPPTVAENFRKLMNAVDSAGIGARKLDFNVTNTANIPRTDAAANITTTTGGDTFNISAVFPGVTNADEAALVGSAFRRELNSLVSRGRALGEI